MPIINGISNIVFISSKQWKYDCCLHAKGLWFFFTLYTHVTETETLQRQVWNTKRWKVNKRTFGVTTSC